MEMTRRRFIALSSMLAAAGATVPKLTAFSLMTAKGQQTVSLDDALWIQGNNWVTHLGVVHGPAKLYEFGLSHDSLPHDSMVDWNLYQDNQTVPLYRVALNTRATYRWVAIPGGEFIVPKGHILKLVGTGGWSRCAHCGHCRNCGKYIALPYWTWYPQPVTIPNPYPYPSPLPYIYTSGGTVAAPIANSQTFTVSGTGSLQ